MTDADKVLQTPSVEDVREWWATSISDISPNIIRLRGYPIEQLIGQVSFVSMIWLMLRGELPSRGQSKLLEASLVASVDHGPQAPSISAARMAATCGLGINSAIATGVGLLGDVHGGAGENCMKLLAAMRDRLRSDPKCSIGQLAEEYREVHQYIPGFGHRFHSIDPRCAPLLALLAEQVQAGEISGEFVQIGQGIEEFLSENKGRRVPMNIDGITAIVYSELGFPPPLGRGLFVLSRSVGIVAHAWEEMSSGSRIKGPMPPAILPTYTGVGKRDFRRYEEEQP